MLALSNSADVVNMTSSATTLVERFSHVPVEMQMQVIAALTSRAHLVSLSRASRRLHTLTAEHLYSHISFGPLDTDTSLLSYLTHCAPDHAHLCRSLKLGFSLGPMISREADLRRADLFVNLLRRTGSDLRELEIDPAGTDLKNTMPLLAALPTMHCAKLNTLRLKIYDVEDDEAPMLARFFADLANHAQANFPALTSMSLEGYWTLKSPSIVFRALERCLRSLTRLEHLRLASLNINKKDLRTLLQAASQPGESCSHNHLTMMRLSLAEVEGVSWRDIVEAIADTPMSKSLKALKLGLSDTDCSERALTCRVALTSLERLDIELARFYPSASADATILCFYRSLCRPDSHPALYMPALNTLSVNDALSYKPGTSEALAALLVRAKMAQVGDDASPGPPVMPCLRNVLVEADAPCTSLQPAERLLEKNGVRVVPAPAQRDADAVEEKLRTGFAGLSKVVYINRSTTEDAIVDSGADEAYLQLLSSAGANVYTV